MMELTNYKISAHAEQRYTSRIMNKDDVNSINKFIIDNKDKIKTDINKMIEFGEVIYSGKQSQKDGKGKVLDVYLKDTWIVLVDNSSNTVVTLYKIDLGCGDEFNLQYIKKMKEKINQSKEKLVAVKSAVKEESDMYKEIIYNNTAQINEYKSYIKKTEELNRGYQSVIDNNIVKISQAEREVADIVNTLVNKREF